MSYSQIKRKINSNKIEEAITDFEAHLDFEFIPVISKKSSYVEHIEWILSLLFLIILVPIIDFCFSHFFYDSWISPIPFYFLSPIVSYIFGFVLDKSDIIDRFFITKNERVKQVQEKAELFFFRNSLYEIESRNVLLLYISVMERQIVIYHDKKIPINEINLITQELLKFLQESFRKKDFESGLLKSIDYLKLKLSPQFSRVQTNSIKNHLPNKLIWID